MAKAKQQLQTKPEIQDDAGAVIATPEPKQKPVSAPKTMEDLLKQSTQTLRVPQVGDVIEGVVTEVGKHQLMIDISAKTEGVVSDREYELAKDYIRDLQVGDTISAYVLSTETERGQIMLSLRKAALNQKWDQLILAMNAGQTVMVDGVEINRGGMVVSFEGLRGFIPTSQFSKKIVENLDGLVGKAFEVKVLEADKDKNRTIFSERYVTEAEELAQKTAILGSLEIGKTYEGKISGVMPFGVFVALQIPDIKSKIEGLVHISEISWEKLDDLNAVYKVGDIVNVKLLTIDQATGKVNLSIKQLSDDPWLTAKDRYPEGSVVQGMVTRIAPFGVFVMIEPGIDGLIHISKIPAGEEPKPHDTIQVSVERVEPDARRMSLGIVMTEVPMGYK